MKKVSLRSQYRKNLLTLHLLTIMVISFVEIIAYIIFLKYPEFIEIHVNHFLISNVITPIVINALSHFAARIIISNKKITNTIKDNAIVFAAYITSSCISFFHREYLPILCSFVFPIILSGFFNNKKILNALSIFSLLSLVVITTIVLWENTFSTTLIVDIIIIFIFVIIAYFSSLLAIVFSHDSFAEIKKQEQENDILQKQGLLDGLTGLYNHETFDDDFAKAITKFNSKGIPFCLAIIDIDDFKLVNDTFGHEQGNTVLMELTNSLCKYCSDMDTIYRYGGEEFVIIFSGQDKNYCISALEKMRRDFSIKTYPFTDTPITFSGGIDMYNGKLSYHEFFNKVDEMLYVAKGSGKNRIVSKLHKSNKK